MLVAFIAFVFYCAGPATADSAETLKLKIAVYHAFPIKSEKAESLRLIHSAVKSAENYINKEVFENKRMIGLDVQHTEFLAIKGDIKFFDENIFGAANLDKLIPIMDATRHPSDPDLQLFVFVGSFIRHQGNKTIQINGASGGINIVLANFFVRSTEDIANTIAHEFGHRLGLRHPNREYCEKTPSIMCEPRGPVIDEPYRKAWLDYYDKHINQN